MRYRIKKNIKNIMKTMMEAHNYAVILLQNRNIAAANDILSQCQDCAMQIGETIEKNGGGETQAVSYLETYCEQLYQMSKIVNKNRLQKLKLQMERNIRCIEYEVDKVIPLDKRKIVFMPYKASMWDCMESVWEAAFADTGCEVYVVPIPYYEREQDGSVKRLCYEGELFPDNVPIISYKEFSVEREHPDIIYIHNPYDEANYVTSVHPDYYSYKLKSYTDQLVYIPYYILGNGPMPETHQNLPSYQHIDKIIVQDKEKADSLIDYIDENKILVIGSPKIDQILKMNKKKKEILESYIPQEWKEKIDGKKIILFNVSISGLLQNSKFAIKKIRYVLSEFEKQKGVVLLWRPHPLLEATLQSMRPELYKEYMDLKKLFKCKQNGILDETSDATISAIISDAYLGENSSSLVHYFGVLGKPVFYINWKLLEDRNNDRGILKFEYFYKENNEIFFVSSNKGQAHDLFQFDLGSGHIEKVITFPGSPDNVYQCYAGIEKMYNKVILLPHNTADIYIYDFNKKSASKIVLEEEHNSMMLFNGAVKYKSKIFLIPKSYPAIVSIDMMTLDVQEFKECVSTFCSVHEEHLLFSCGYVKKDKYLYLAGGNESRIIIFNMENGNYTIKKIGNFSYGYGHMIYDGRYFWLSAYKESCIIRWDEISGETKKYVYPNKIKKAKDEIWSVLLDYKDEIIVCKGHSLEILFINKLTGKYKNKEVVVNKLKKIKNKTDRECGFNNASFLDKETIMFVEKNGINIWNINTNQWKNYGYRLTTNEMLNAEKRFIEKYSIIKSVPYSLTENEITISQYIDYILAGETDSFSQVYECYYNNDDSSIGETVHRNMIS